MRFTQPVRAPPGLEGLGAEREGPPCKKQVVRKEPNLFTEGGRDMDSSNMTSVHDLSK